MSGHYYIIAETEKKVLIRTTANHVMQKVTVQSQTDL